MTKIQIMSDETLTMEEVKEIIDTVKRVERNKPERTVYIWIVDKDLKERSVEEAAELVQYFVEDRVAG